MQVKNTVRFFLVARVVEGWCEVRERFNVLCTATGDGGVLERSSKGNKLLEWKTKLGGMSRDQGAELYQRKPRGYPTQFTKIHLMIDDLGRKYAR